MKAVDDGIWIASQHPFGDPLDAITRRFERKGGLSVPLESRWIAMKAIGVELDHDPPRRPEEVDHAPLDQGVARRRRQPRLPAESQEVDLYSGAGVVSPRIGVAGRVA